MKGGIKMTCGIYKITNKITGKIYIGQSIDCHRRWWEHKARAFDENNNCYQKPLYRSIRKYGLDSFHFEIIEECDAELLNEKEAFYIQYFNCITPNGYNILSTSNKSVSQIDKCKKCGAVISHGTQSSLCRSCYAKTTRVAERPTKDELYQLLVNFNFVKVGQMFNVSDNTIRKWCASYGLSTKAKDYKIK